MRSDSLAFRLVAGAALWSVVALVAGGLILSAIFRNSVERSFDGRLDVLLDSLIATTEVDDAGNIVRLRDLSETRFDLVYSGWYWQVSPLAERPALRSRSLFDQTLDLAPAAAPVATITGSRSSMSPARKTSRCASPNAA